MSWPVVKISDITEVVTKGTTPTTYGMPFTDDGINFIKAEALNGDSALDHGGFTFVSEDTHAKLARSILKENDVLVTIAGANVGRCGYVQERDLPANTNQAVGIVRVDPEKAEPRFVYYYFKHPTMRARCLNIGGQAAQPNVNLGNLKSFDVPLPDRTVQRRIAFALSAYDDLIENNRRRIVLLEEAARLLYREWFVHFRFPGNEHVKMIDGVPEGWEQGKVSDLGTAITGKTPSKKIETNFGDDIPFIKTPDMHGNAIIIKTMEALSEQGANTQKNKTLPIGSILVSCIGTVGTVSMNSCPAQTNQQINAIIPKESEWRFFAYFALKSIKPRLEAMGGGATMANVNKAKFESVPVLIPSKALIRSFHESVKALFELIEKLARQNLELARARDLLLPRLMDGRLEI